MSDMENRLLGMETAVRELTGVVGEHKGVVEQSLLQGKTHEGRIDECETKQATQTEQIKTLFKSQGGLSKKQTAAVGVGGISGVAALCKVFYDAFFKGGS